MPFSNRVFAMKEFRGRFLRDISTEKATNFVPIWGLRKLQRNFPAHPSNPECNAHKILSNAWGPGVVGPRMLTLSSSSSALPSETASKTPQQSSKRRMRKRSRAQRPLTPLCRPRLRISPRAVISWVEALVVHQAHFLRNFLIPTKVPFPWKGLFQ